MKAAEALTDTTAGTGHLYKAVAIVDQKLANDGAEATGLLTQNGQSGQHVSFMVSGVGKYVAGAGIAAGALLTVTTSGYVITSTGSDNVVGRALDTGAVTSGSVGTGLFEFAKPSINT